MRRQAALVALALAGVGLVVGPAASRAGATVDDLVLAPSPGSELDTASGAVAVSAQPGGGVWQSAVVTNRGPVPRTVHLAASAWVRPAVDRVLLEPGSSETVAYTVAPPADAPPGTTPAELVAEVDGAAGARRVLAIAVTVLPGASVPRNRPERAAPDAPAASHHARSRTVEVLVLLAVGAVLVGVVGALTVPSVLRAAQRTRAALRAAHRTRTALRAAHRTRAARRAAHRTRAARRAAHRTRAMPRAADERGRRRDDGAWHPPAPVGFVDPLTGRAARRVHAPVAPARATPPRDDPRPRRVAVRALDVDALNRQLASAPSQGSRAASAQSRSSP
jgi:hypothetical protein